MKEEKILKNKRFRIRKADAFFLSAFGSANKVEGETNYILNNVVSLFIYLLAFFISFYIKKRTLILDYNYTLLLGFLTISLILGALLSNKFILTVQHELWQMLRKLCISVILTLGFLSLALLVFDVTNISRVLLIRAMLGGFVVETYYYFLISERRKKSMLPAPVKFRFSYLFIDGIILTLFCYTGIIEIIKLENLSEKHYIILVVIYISWLFSGAATHKFQLLNVAKSLWLATGLQIKYYLLIISFTLLSVFLLQIDPPAWGYFIEGVFKYSLVSGLLALLLFAEKIRSKTDEAAVLFLKAYELKEVPVSFVHWDSFSKYGFVSTQESESIVKHKLQFEYLKEHQDVFTFIDKKLDLKSFDIRKTLIIKSADPYNINVLQPNSQELIVNLHVLNDQIKINDYLRIVNKKLVNGGVFVGTIVPNKNRYRRYLKKYPFLIANVFYLIDFIWKRAFPKLPIAKKIYFVLSKGKDRAISLAEGLGRLVFCGFEILTLTEINDQVYFVAGKVKETSHEKNPYYSPIFKMRRVGKGGKTIFVYKLRTMHPYSELIQNFIYLRNEIQEGGKFKDDFRIPGWGKFFRSVWIDELPMIINLLKRDLKLVGVRPISQHYMSLYSKEHQQRRKQFKPGLVPPYYADMPKTIEEIEKSEKLYLDAYEKNPIMTDIKYFLKVFKNILIMEKRSA